VVVKVSDAQKETEEIIFNKLFLWNPKLFTAIIDN